MNAAEKPQPKEYAATYRFKGSKAVVHVVAPPPMSEAEKEKILKGVYAAFWACWDSIPVEEQLRINAECEAGLIE